MWPFIITDPSGLRNGWFTARMAIDYAQDYFQQHHQTLIVIHTAWCGTREALKCWKLEAYVSWYDAELQLCDLWVTPHGHIVGKMEGQKLRCVFRDVEAYITDHDIPFQNAGGE